MKKQIVYILIILGTMVYSCNNGDSAEVVTEEVKEESTSVVLSNEQLNSLELKMIGLEERKMSKEIKVNGVVELAVNGKAWVSAPVAGLLGTIRVALNQNVKKGQVLATYSDQSIIEWQGEYLQKVSELKRLEKDLNRQEGLLKSDAASEKSLDLLRSERESVFYRVETLKKKLKYLGLEPEQILKSGLVSWVEIKSPLDGQISSIFATPGQYVDPTAGLFEVVEPSGAYVLLHVFESDVEHIKKGQQVHVNGPLSWIGEVESVGTVMKDDRTVDVVVNIIGDRSGLIGGMFVETIVMSENAESWVLPSESIVEFEGSHYIFSKLSSNEFVMEKVQVGLEQDNYIEILQADYTLLRSKEIVAKGAYDLLMALKNKEE
jgi:cobalt-zinc-cadmium efflux system membrane fusion protein